MGNDEKLSGILKAELEFVAWANSERAEFAIEEADNISSGFGMPECCCHDGVAQMHFGPMIGYYYITCDGCGRCTGTWGGKYLVLSIWNKIHDID